MFCHQVVVSPFAALRSRMCVWICVCRIWFVSTLSQLKLSHQKTLSNKQTSNFTAWSGSSDVPLDGGLSPEPNFNIQKSSFDFPLALAEWKANAHFNVLPFLASDESASRPQAMKARQWKASKTSLFLIHQNAIGCSLLNFAQHEKVYMVERQKRRFRPLCYISKLRWCRRILGFSSQNEVCSFAVLIGREPMLYFRSSICENHD